MWTAPWQELSDVSAALVAGVAEDDVTVLVNDVLGRRSIAVLRTEQDFVDIVSRAPKRSSQVRGVAT